MQRSIYHSQERLEDEIVLDEAVDRNLGQDYKRGGNGNSAKSCLAAERSSGSKRGPLNIEREVFQGVQADDTRAAYQMVLFERDRRFIASDIADPV